MSEADRTDVSVGSGGAFGGEGCGAKTKGFGAG